MAELVIRPATVSDLEMVAEWLLEPRVAAWVGGPGYAALLASHQQDPRIDQWIVEQAGTAIAYIQDYAIGGFAGHPLSALPLGARGLDTFMARGAEIGQGLGPRYIAQHAGALFARGASALGVDPHPQNTAARRAYAKAGFRETGCALAPWGPVTCMDLWPATP